MFCAVLSWAELLGDSYSPACLHEKEKFVSWKTETPSTPQASNTKARKRKSGKVETGKKKRLALALSYQGDGSARRKEKIDLPGRALLAGAMRDESNAHRTIYRSFAVYLPRL